MTCSSKKLTFPSFIECWFFILHLWSAFIACGLVGRGDPLIRQFLVHDGFSYQSCPTHLLLALTRPTTFFVIVMSFLFFQQAVVFETLSYKTKQYVLSFFAQGTKGHCFMANCNLQTFPTGKRRRGTIL